MSDKTMTKNAFNQRRQFLKTVSLGGAAVFSFAALPHIVDKRPLEKPKAMFAQVSVDLGYKKPKHV